MTHPSMSSDSDIDTQQALDIARRLIVAGIPVFAAPPDPESPLGYRLPKYWEQTYPSEVNLDKWQPGWALAAVGGHAADFLDVDPRNGGDASAADLTIADHWPRTFGQQATPSGGMHYIISPTGERKGVPLAGIDLQSGAPDGTGRGFVWIAPTVRRSKVTGELKAYRWEIEPDTEQLAEWAGQDDSTEHVISLVRAKRSASGPPRQRQPVDPDDPFMTASSAGSTGERSFTMAQAQDFVRPYLVRLREAQIGEIEETANVAVAALSHFTRGFWTPEEAFALIADALSYTAYDPDRPGASWRAGKFMPVLDGRRPPLDPWVAVRVADAPTGPDSAVETEPGQETLSTLEKLRRKLISGDDLAGMPTPEPLVMGLLDLDTESWLIGAPGSLKSFVALDLAGHVGAGRDWQGHKVRQGPVLYLAAEGARGMVLRTRAWRKIYGSMPGVTFLPYPVKVVSSDGQWGALTEIARELKPVLVVIDTQARVTTGLEENSAKDMGVFTDAVAAIKRATGACVLVVHHTGRNGGDARGSSALDGAQDTELKVVRATPRSTLQCRLVQDKQKDMAEGAADGIELVFKVVDLGEDLTTGRSLSSLVLMGESEAAFHLAQHSNVLDDVDLAEYVGREPAPWTAMVPGVPAKAKLKRRILQALFDHAHSRGLTRADALKVITARWGKPGDERHWVDTWNAVVSLPVVMNLGGERWGVDHVEVLSWENGQE